jgi:hypothetical protein
MTEPTDAEILEIAEKYFDYQGGWIADKEQLLKFVKEIRRQTRRDILHEIIARLSSAPNAEVNQYAIILIEKQLITND